MHVIKRATLIDFAERHADVTQALLSWYKTVSEADWTTPNDLKKQFPSASLIDGHRVVFNIKGNEYRMLVYIQYRQPWMRQGTVFIKRVMTHAEYDKLDMKNTHYEG